MIYLVKCCKKDNKLQANYIIATDDSELKVAEILKKDKKFQRVADEPSAENFFIKHHAFSGNEIETKIITHGGNKEVKTISFISSSCKKKNIGGLLTGVIECDDKTLHEKSLFNLPKGNYCFGAEYLEDMMDNCNYPCEEPIFDVLDDEGNKVTKHFVCAKLKDYIEIMEVVEKYQLKVWYMDWVTPEDYTEEMEEKYLNKL